MRNQVGLGTRLNLLIIGINLIMLSAVAYTAIASGNLVLRDQELTQFAAQTQRANLALDAELMNIEMLGNAIADQIANLDDVDSSATINEAILASLDQQDTRLVHSINVLRPDNTVIWIDPHARGDEPSLRTLPITDEQNTLSFQEAITEGDPIWLTQQASEMNLDAEAVISHAVPYENGEQSGLIWIDILQSDLQAVAQDILTSVGLVTDASAGYSLIINNTDAIIDVSDALIDMNDAFAIQEILEQITNVNLITRGFYEIKDPVQLNALSVLRVQDLSVDDWELWTFLPDSEIRRLPFDIYFPIVLVALTGIAGLILAVSRFMKRSMVEPLIDLGRIAAEMGESNLRLVVFHQDKRNEIGRLARAMESMKNRLRESYDELESFNQRLERRVEERTMQLDAAQRQAQKNAQQLQAVYDESLSVVNEAQLQPVLDTFIDRILGLLDASYCAVWLLEEDRRTVRLVATNDSRRRISTGTVTMDVQMGIVGQAIRLDQAIIVNDYENYEYRASLPEHYAENNVPFYRGVCTPLKFAGSEIGAVIVGRNKDSDPFDLESQRQLTLFANMVSPSVRNAQLFGELQEAIKEAKQANEVKTRFLASVTHELRTPLNLIINNMDFMRVGAFGDVTDEQISRLNQTVRSAEHLLYLINDLLDVSKIEAGEMQLFIQQSELYTMIEDAIDNAYAVMENYDDKADHVTLRFEIDDDLPEIPIDSRRIRQVLNNLLSNGIKFTKEGSVTLKVFQTEDGVHFSVHDTGMGIPQSEMRKLFAAFERTNAAKQNGIEGTGLGLPISRYLVQQHGSDLTVTSAANVGTTFAFTLPLDTEVTMLQSMSDTQRITAIFTSEDE